MSDDLTSVLDFIGVMFLAIGVGCLVGNATGNTGLGLIAAGFLIIIGSFVASALSAARTARSDE